MDNIYIYLKTYKLDLTQTVKNIQQFYPTILFDPNKNEVASLFTDIDMTNSLLLTDDETAVSHCLSHNVPCVVVLHDNNKSQNFPMGIFCIDGLNDIDMDYLLKVYQRYKKIPWTILETNRLLLREISVEDVPRLFELYEDKDITLYMEDLFRPIEKEIEYTQNYIDNIYNFYGYGIWLIVLKESNEIIGRCGVEFKEGFDGLELGFMLGKNYWHKGYALEACDAVIKYSSEYLGENNIRAIIHKDNTSSINLCKKLGFTYDGPIEDNYISYSNQI